MRKPIQCWQCGTRMTLDALASNDGDCPECEVEIHLGEYFSEALDTNQRLEAECKRLLDLLADWSSHFTGPKVIGGPLSSLRERTDAALLNGGRE